MSLFGQYKPDNKQNDAYETPNDYFMWEPLQQQQQQQQEYKVSLQLPQQQQQPLQRKRLHSCGSCRCVLQLLTLLISAAALTVAVMYFYRFAHAQQKTFTTVVLDEANTRNCTVPLGGSELPCMNGIKYITSGQPLGPLRQHNDHEFVQHKKLGGSPKTGDFTLAADGRGLVIPRSAAYFVQAKVTFYDNIKYYVEAHIRIEPSGQRDCKGSHICEAAQDKLAHSWLTCLQQNAVDEDGKPRFASCSMAGVRQFTAGDKLSLYIKQKYRSVNAFFKATYLSIHEI